MKAIERELELTTRALLAANQAAGEDWAAEYARAPKQHAELIKLTAKMHRQVFTYLRELAKQAPQFVNWFEYHSAVFEQQRQMSVVSSEVEAYNVNVVVKNDNVSQSDQQFIKVVFDTVAATIATGAESMVVEHGRPPIGLTTTSVTIQNLTTEQLANLVGMKVVDKNKPTEHVIPNPNPAYNIDETTRTRIANSIKTSIRLGENQEQAVKRLQQVIADPARADMIAYTETVRAYATGRATYAQQSGAVAKHWYDSNAIDICSDNTAEGWIPMGADFVSGDPNEPAHPNCLIEGTVVSATAIQATSKRFYEGRVVTITTARGNKLTVTPNHPVLTSSGWIVASKLQEGDNLASCINPQGVTSVISPNNYNTPSLIEEVVESFESAFAVSTVTVPTTTKDFHGDGIDGQVAVINTNRFLRGNTPSKLMQPDTQQHLGRTYMKLLCLSRLSSFQLSLNRIVTAASSLMRSMYPQTALFGRSTGNHLSVGISHGPNFDATLDEELFDNLTGTATLSRQLEERFPGNIAPDKIVSVVEENFSGHVYNLETSTGWYIANSIITHNCRCLTVYSYDQSDLADAGITDVSEEAA